MEYVITVTKSDVRTAFTDIIAATEYAAQLIYERIAFSFSTEGV